MKIQHRILTALGIAAMMLGATLWTPAQGQASDPDVADMSMTEIVKAAGEMVQAMEDQLSKAFKLLEESIAADDMAAIQARNEAITAMKGLIKLSEENYFTLQQKVAEGDREAAEHEYVKISIAAAKVQELFAQVQTAGGIQIDIELAGVEKSLDIESDLPVGVELAESFVQTSEVLPDPPVHASPYQ